jgi:hypothetical protein
VELVSKNTYISGVNVDRAHSIRDRPEALQ